MIEWSVKFFLVWIVWACFICLYGLCGMWLWNILIPEIFGLPQINWIQCIGLMCLCSLILRGFNINFSTAKNIKQQ